VADARNDFNVDIRLHGLEKRCVSFGVKLLVSAAHAVLNRGSIRRLNSAKNGDAQAATLMFLVFSGEIKATDPVWPDRSRPRVG